MLPDFAALLYPVTLADGTRVDVAISARHPELDRVVRATGGRSWAYLTAWNPMGVARPLAENVAANAELARALRDFLVRPAPGGYDPAHPDPSTQEASFWVAGITLRRATAVARAHHQLAFVFGRVDAVATLVWVA